MNRPRASDRRPCPDREGEHASLDYQRAVSALIDGSAPRHRRTSVSRGGRPGTPRCRSVRRAARPTVVRCRCSARPRSAPIGRIKGPNPRRKGLSAGCPAHEPPLGDLQGQDCRYRRRKNEDERLQRADLGTGQRKHPENRQADQPNRGCHCRSAPWTTDAPAERNSDWKDQDGHVTSQASEFPSARGPSGSSRSRWITRPKVSRISICGYGP